MNYYDYNNKAPSFTVIDFDATPTDATPMVIEWPDSMIKDSIVYLIRKQLERDLNNA